MIAIIGESASGKTTLANALVAYDPKYRKLVTYTTRPMREDETMEDYRFIKEETFSELSKRDFFIDESTYNNWRYGIAKIDCTGGTNNVVAVLTPANVRKLKRAGYDVISVYLHVDRESRMIQMIERGDNIEEAYRRSLSDLGQFDGVIEEADYVIENQRYHMNVKSVLTCLLQIINTANEKQDGESEE